MNRQRITLKKTAPSDQAQDSNPSPDLPHLPDIAGPLRDLLTEALQMKAEQIILIPSPEGHTLNFIIHQTPCFIREIPSYLYDEILIRLRLSSGISSDAQAPAMGRLRMSEKENEQVFHVSILPVGDSQRLNIRIHRGFNGDIPGMPPRGMEFLQQVMSRGGGLVIIGGIRGSGRSATLEALAGHMSAKPVLMIEDRPGPALKGVDRISADNQNLETLIPHILAQGYEGLAVENAMPGDLPLLLRTASAGLSVAVTAWGRSAPEIVEAFSTDKSTRLELGNLLEGIIHQERTKVPCHCHLPGGCEECLHTGVADTCCRFTLLCPAPALRDSLRRGMDREIILKDCRESILIDPDHPIYNLNNGGYYA